MKWGRVRSYKSTRFRQSLIKVRLEIAERSGIPYSYLWLSNNKGWGLSKEGIESFKELEDAYNNTVCNAVKNLPRKLKKKYKRKFIL